MSDGSRETGVDRDEETAQEAFDPAEIARFLTANPDFLSSHPAVLAALELRHDTSAGSSLIEHQVAVLRERVAELEERLGRYHDSAAANEATFRRVHALYLAMLATGDAGELISLLETRLTDEFGCDAVAIAVVGEEALAGVVSLKAGKGPLADVIASGEPACGRLSATRLGAVFDEAIVADLKSAAIVPWLLPAAGALVLGSRDEDKFYPGMGTLFLAFLGQMVGQRLAALGATAAATTDA